MSFFFPPSLFARPRRNSSDCLPFWGGFPQTVFFLSKLTSSRASIGVVLFLLLLPSNSVFFFFFLDAEWLFSLLLKSTAISLPSCLLFFLRHFAGVRLLFAAAERGFFSFHPVPHGIVGKKTAPPSLPVQRNWRFPLKT